MKVCFHAFGKDFFFSAEKPQPTEEQIKEANRLKEEYEYWRKEVCSRPPSPDTIFPPGHED